jgi:hypothetical protein
MSAVTPKADIGRYTTSAFGCLFMSPRPSN